MDVIKGSGGEQTEARRSEEERDLFGSGSWSGLIGQDYQKRGVDSL